MAAESDVVVTLKPILLLIDLNGVVLHRSEERIMGVKEDLYLRNRYYYFRENLGPFLKAIGNHFCIALYSSVTGRNLDVVRNVLDPGDCIFDYTFDREFNKMDEFGVESHDTIRDFHKIWDQTGYECTNTIMLENDARKIREYPQIGILLPEFNESEVRRRDPKMLYDLESYLLTMYGMFGVCQDVSSWMEQHPFHRFPSVVWTSATRFPIMPESPRGEEELEGNIDQEGVIGLKDFPKSMIIEKIENKEVYYQERHVKSSLQVRINMSDMKIGVVFPKNIQLARLLEVCGENVIIQRRKNDQPIDISPWCSVNVDALKKFLYK